MNDFNNLYLNNFRTKVNDVTERAKKNTQVNLFDISRTYRDVEGTIAQDKLPQEDNILTLASYGKNMDFYVLKGIVENIFETSSVKRYEISSVDNLDAYHPGRTAKITIGNDTVAVLGQIHPIVTRKLWCFRRSICCRNQYR